MAPKVFHQMVYHCVWSTKERHPFIPEEVREWVIGCVECEARKRFGIVHACNAMPDHVHLLVSLPPTVELATFIGQVKGASSHAFHAHYGPTRFLKWQEGYAIVTLRKGEIGKVARYIRDQQTRHAAGKLSRILEITEADEED